MIEVDGKQLSPQPTTLEGIYELLEPYHRRTVRLKAKIQRYDRSWGGYITTTLRSMGELVGLSLSAPCYGDRKMQSSDDKLIFFLQGQSPMDFDLGEFAVDVFQEDSREWVTVYDPQSSKETDR